MVDFSLLGVECAYGETLKKVMGSLGIAWLLLHRSR